MVVFQIHAVVYYKAINCNNSLVKNCMFNWVMTLTRKYIVVPKHSSLIWNFGLVALCLPAIGLLSATSLVCP